MSVLRAWQFSIIHLTATYRLLATTKELRVIDGVVVVGPDDVETQPGGRLVCHLDSVLQNRHRERVGWITGQPHTEVRVGCLWVEFLWKVTQVDLGHPHMHFMLLFFIMDY